MAKPTKRRVEGTASAQPAASAKKTKQAPGAAKGAKGAPARSGKAARNAKGARGGGPRQQPQQPLGPSPKWVPVLMFTFFAIGMVVVPLNYFEALPSSPSPWYMLGGLTSILLGIVTATQYR